MIRLPAALLPLSLLPLAACPGPDLGEDPSLVPGTGEVEFIALEAAGNDLPLVSGVQGGTHVWGAARVAGIDWRDVTISWTLLDAEGEVVTPPTTIAQALQACGQGDEGCRPGVGEVVAVPVVLEEPGTLRGDDLTMRVHASDDEGREATAERPVRPVVAAVVE